jgi:hypothetical protein
MTWNITKYVEIHPTGERSQMKSSIKKALLVALALTLSGCVVAPVGPGPGWCFYHPYRCGR